MRVLAVGVEDALTTPMDRLQHPHLGEDKWSADRSLRHVLI